MRILMTDGSGLTSRQCATVLSRAGHVVEALTSDPLCVCAFTRHVRRLHRVPPYGDDPFAWLEAALTVYEAGGFDVLPPTQEQVAVLSRAADGRAATVVPPFAALARVQDKLSAAATLAMIQTVFRGGAACLPRLPQGGRRRAGRSRSQARPRPARRPRPPGQARPGVVPARRAVGGHHPRPRRARLHRPQPAPGRAGERTGRREAVLRELVTVAARRGGYAGSREELTPGFDPRSALLVALAAGATIARPDLWRWFAAGSVRAYALSGPAWRRIVRGPVS
ncbi:hypothetical protein [Nonomuraea sp. NPDC049504]|uniref:hypothetical protein n=1 Tax=Nonomuraea sp. NPDC049504 TaxID=3154729 RepID=UPI00342CBD15